MNTKLVVGVAACAASVALSAFADVPVYKATADVSGVDLAEYAPDRMEGPAPGNSVTIDGPISGYAATVEQPFTFQGDTNSTSTSYGTLNLENVGTLTDGSVPLAFEGYGVTYLKDPYVIGPGWTKTLLQVKDANAAVRFSSVNVSGTKETPARFDLTPDGPINDKEQGQIYGLAKAPGSRGVDNLRIGRYDNGDGVMTLTDCESFFGDYVYLGCDGENVTGTLALTNSWMDAYFLYSGTGTPGQEAGVTNVVILGPGATLNVSQPITLQKDPSLAFRFAGGKWRSREGNGYIFQTDNLKGRILVTNELGCDFVFDVPNQGNYRDLFPNGKQVDVVGNGDFVKQGKGVLKIAAPVTGYTGDTVIEEGTLRVSGVGSLPFVPIRAADGTKIELEHGGRLAVPFIEGKVSVQSTGDGTGTLAIGDENDIVLSGVAANVSLEKTGSGTMTMYGMRGRKLAVDEGKLIVEQAMKPSRYWRFKVDAISGNVDMMQFSELKLYSGGADVTSTATVTWDTEHTTAKHAGDNKGLPYPDAESPGKAFDGSVDTKWLDWRAGVNESAEVRDSVWLCFDFDEPIAIDKYEWYTANDETGRDPTSWRFERSEDGAVWVTVDEQANVAVTNNRKALAYTYESEQKAGGDVVLDEIGVAEGAELEVHGVAVKTKQITGDGSIKLLDGATLELVADDGELEGVNVSTVSFGDGPGEIVKNGNGTVKMFGLDGYAGAVTVNTGTLKILKIGPCKWFRWTVKRVYGDDSMQLSEFSLYDEYGDRVNVGMSKADDGTTELQPGQFAQVGAYSVGGNGGEGVDKAFDGNIDTKWCLTDVTMNNPDNSSTWRAVLLRLPSNAASVVAYSFTTANDVTPGRNPSTWVLEASEDGIDWVPVDDQTNVGSQPTAFKTESSKYSISAIEDEPTVLPFAADATVMVAAGATFDSSVPIPNLIVDCEVGAGTLTTFNPAEGGMLRLVNVGETALDGFVVPVTVGEFAANASTTIKSWKVMVEGVVSANYAVRIRDGKLVVVRMRGLSVMVR